jgi:hypothetical protein
MILPTSLLLLFSLLWGFSPWRMQRYGYLFTNVVSALLTLFAIFLWSGIAEVNSENGHLLTILGLEVFAFYFLIKRDQKVSLLPYYSIPLIQLAYLSIVLTYPLERYSILYLFGALFIDFFIGASEKRTRENIGKTLLMVVSLVTLLLITKFDSTNLSFFLLAFIYWMAQKVFPLGLTRGDNQAVAYSVTGRVALFVLASQGLPIELNAWTIYIIGILLAAFSICTFFLLEDDFKGWGLIKQSNEIILILLNILVLGTFGKDSLVLIILFNLYFFLPFVLAYLEKGSSLMRISQAGAFLLINGIFIGAIGKLINNALKESVFSHFGLDIFYLFGAFWLLNIAFALKFSNLRMEKRKIDHFHPLLLASVIITSIVISI